MAGAPFPSKCLQKVDCEYRARDNEINVWSRDTRHGHHWSIPILDDSDAKYLNQAVLDARPLLIQNGVIVLMAKNEVCSAATHTYDHKFIVLDLHNEICLGFFDPPNQVNADFLSGTYHVFSSSLNKTRDYISMCTFLVTEKTAYSYAGEFNVVVYDVHARKVQMLIDVGHMISPCAAFSPKEKFKLFSVHEASTSDNDIKLSTYDVTSGEEIQSKSLKKHGIELDIESTAQISFSKDGSFMILQLLEPVWYNTDFLCRMFLLRIGRGLQKPEVFQKYSAFVFHLCHSECVLNILPETDQSDSYIVGPVANRTDPYPRGGMALPNPHDLMGITRRNILKCIKEESDVYHLPLPPVVQNYLNFK